MDTAHAGSARQRRPSMAQRPLLEALADLGGTATAGEIVDRVQRAGTRKPGVDQWIAVESAGWCTVDRAAPANTGGTEPGDVHTLTPAGWAAAGWDQATTGNDPHGRGYAIARRGARLILTVTGHPPLSTTSERGEHGAANADALLRVHYPATGNRDEAHLILDGAVQPDAPAPPTS